jgi:hypothetical protein
MPFGDQKRDGDFIIKDPASIDPSIVKKVVGLLNKENNFHVLKVEEIVLFRTKPTNGIFVHFVFYDQYGVLHSVEASQADVTSDFSIISYRKDSEKH